MPTYGVEPYPPRPRQPTVNYKDKEIRLYVYSEDRTYVGNALRIVKMMAATQRFFIQLSLETYLKFATLVFPKKFIKIEGENIEDRCNSMVNGLIYRGLARKLRKKE